MLGSPYAILLFYTSRHRLPSRVNGDSVQEVLFALRPFGRRHRGRFREGEAASFVHSHADIPRSRSELFAETGHTRMEPLLPHWFHASRSRDRTLPGLLRSPVSGMAPLADFRSRTVGRCVCQRQLPDRSDGSFHRVTASDCRPAGNAMAKRCGGSGPPHHRRHEVLDRGRAELLHDGAQFDT
jgi:hypothetical protein